MSNPWDAVVGTAAYNANLSRLQRVAQSKGFDLNPDPKRVKKVVGLMTQNYNEHGSYYCPCKQSEPLDPEKDVCCPCPAADAEVQKDGCCFCRLFFKKEAS